MIPQCTPPVNDAVALEVLPPNDELRANLVFRGVSDRHAHGLDPTLGDLVQLFRELLGHEKES